MLDTPDMSRVSPSKQDTSFLGRILVLGDEKIVEAVRHVLTRGDAMKTSNTATLNRIALSKFLNNLREEVDVVPPEKKPNAGKEIHAKDVLNKEFGKDGGKLKMKIIEDDVRDEVTSTDVESGDSLPERKGAAGRLGDDENKKPKDGQTPRKVSFKVNKVTAGGRRNRVAESRVVLNSNKVAALASKYNSLIDDVDTSKANDGTIVIRTPNQRQDIRVVVSRKTSALKRDNSSASLKSPGRKAPDDFAVFGRTKDKKNVSITYRPPVLKSRSGNVKAAIQIFEQNSTIIRVKPAGTANRDEKTGNKDTLKKDNNEEKENLKNTTVTESRTLVPRFSTLYKDYNKAFKQNLEDNTSVKGAEEVSVVQDSVPALKSETGANECVKDVNKSAASSESSAKGGSKSEGVRNDANRLVENKSTLYSGQSKYGASTVARPAGGEVKPRDCLAANNGHEKCAGEQSNRNHEHTSSTEHATKQTAKESQQTYVDIIDTGHYETVQTGESVQTGPKQTNKLAQPERKISKITKKVISFSGKTRSKFYLGEDVVKASVPQALVEPPIETADEEGLEGYEKIGAGSPKRDLEDYETMQESTSSSDAPRIEPNTSFLWGTRRGDAPSLLPLPPVPDIEIPDMYAYDDVYPPTSGCDALHYSSVKIEDIYDDVGVDAKAVSVDSWATYDGIGHGETLLVSMMTKTETADETASCRYDYVSSRPCAATPSYQDLEEDNIYDDVKTLSTKEDAVSISNCYESIYDGRGNGSTKEAVNSLYGVKEAVKYESSGGSSISGCDQNNSLYGGLLGPRFDSATGSQASTASVEDGPQEVLTYQLTSLGVTNKSDTSDEWVDLEPSDSEAERGTINLVVHDRSRCRRSPSWSQKVRRQWSKSPRTFAGASGGESSDDSDHHYEMLDDVVDKAAGTDIPFDDFDSFDSDSSIEHTLPSKPVDDYNNRLPDPPASQNIYGITKIAEAAGNKLLQLRKSLSKMRPKRHTTEIQLSDAGPPPLSIAPLAAPTRLEKTTSSGNLSNKKYWSLRKFKRSSSTVSQSASKFYVTDAVDVDTGQTEAEQKRNSVVSESSEISNGHEATSPSSSKTSVNEVGVENGIRKNSKPAVYERRPSARPNSPPPLPPPLANTEGIPKRPNRKDKRSTSWYAECGLFDGSDSNNLEAKRNAKKERTTSNSWYAEVGLWDEANSSSQPSSLTQEQPDINSSAETSDCSVSPENSGVERRFIDEPLYQFYTASIVELARRDMSGEFDSDGYEEIGERGVKLTSRPTAMELIQPREGLHRTLWCQIPEVINSRVLSTINPHQKKLQEAKFEIIASEASYLKSLNVLEKHFISSAEFNDEAMLSKSDRRILFSNVAPVKNCSKRFLAELEKCWQDNILLTGICDVIFKFATDNFNSYIKYCSNQIYLDRTLRRLKEQNGKFAEVLTQLESTPGCQSLSLHSFLMLPMQRITRLPLLVDAVLTRLDTHDDEYPNCKMALATLNKIVKDCNEGARRMERMEEILILSRQLEFPREVKAVPIISSTRWLVRSGELTQLIFRGDEAKLTFGKKFSKSTLHFFLFTDLLVITKKKSEDCYVVTDYCPRNMAQMSSGEGLAHLPVKFLTDGGRNLVLLTMLQNHEKKTVEMILSCAVESDRQRWLQATSQPTSENPDESVYEEWDCPQVTTVHPFNASQPDELSLDISDVVNVFRKTPDGWYHGERMRDGEQGWFPGNYSVEIASAHVRAKNLKQRYRLLALSANYLESQRKEKK